MDCNREAAAFTSDSVRVNRACEFGNFAAKALRELSAERPAELEFRCLESNSPGTRINQNLARCRRRLHDELFSPRLRDSMKCTNTL